MPKNPQKPREKNDEKMTDLLREDDNTVIKDEYERYLLAGGANKYRYVYSLRIVNQHSLANQIPTLVAYGNRYTML